MRNLKKVLALTLAVVMLVGMMVVSAGAVDYKDAANIEHDEAVAVMSAIGVFNGTDAGEFLPKGNLTREQAAKIITYMLMGQKSADKLGTATAPFNDVAATRWSAGSIAYCVSTGILAGDGNGNFFPTQNVDGYAFGKMLLVAIGAEGEYTGANWAINVAADVIKLGLDENVCASLADTLTREEACQMAFNALKYTDNEKTTKYVVGAYTTTDFVNAYIVADGDMSKIQTITTTSGALADTVYGLKSTGTWDGFGRPTTTWTSSKDKDLKVVIANEATLTYTTAISPNALYNALDLDAATTVEYIIDGAYVKEGLDVYKTGEGATDKTIGAAGATTEVFVDGDAITVTVVYNYLAKVTKVTAAKAATATKEEVKASVEMTIYNVYGSEKDLEKVYFETDKFAKGDMIVVNYNGEVKAAEKANKVEGVLKSFKGATLNVDGTTYNVGAMSVAPAAADIGFKDTYTYYLDANDAILGADKKVAAVVTDYVYILKYQAEAGDDADLINAAGKNAAVATAIFTDGTAKTINLAITEDDDVYYTTVPAKDGTVKEVELATKAATEIGNWFAYTVKDGVYTLVEIDADYAAVETDVDLVKGASKNLGGLYTNSATKIVTIDEDDKMTTTTGFVAKDVTLTGNVLYTYAKDAKVVSAIYAVEQAAASAEDITYAYAVEAGATTSDGATWTFAVDGAQVTYVLEAKQTVEAGKVYTLSDTDADNAWTVKAAEVVEAGEISVLDTTFLVAADEYVINEKAAVYNVAETAEVVGAKDTLAEGDTISVILNKDGEIVVAYITVEAE